MKAPAAIPVKAPVGALMQPSSSAPVKDDDEDNEDDFPAKAPVAAPIKVPTSVPLKSPATVPVKAPVAVPVKSPSAAPVKDDDEDDFPVNAPVTALVKENDDDVDELLRLWMHLEILQIVLGPSVSWACVCVCGFFAISNHLRVV